MSCEEDIDSLHKLEQTEGCVYVVICATLPCPRLSSMAERDSQKTMPVSRNSCNGTQADSVTRCKYPYCESYQWDKSS